MLRAFSAAAMSKRVHTITSDVRGCDTQRCPWTERLEAFEQRVWVEEREKPSFHIGAADLRPGHFGAPSKCGAVRLLYMPSSSSHSLSLIALKSLARKPASYPAMGPGCPP